MATCKGAKGQAAIEYLVTYGWILIVILVVLGFIIYFNLFNAKRFLPEHCNFGDQLQCVDFSITTSGGTGTVSLILENNFAKEIQINNITSPDPQVLLNACHAVTIKPGNSSSGDPANSFHCDISMPYNEGDKEQFTFILGFQRYASPLTTPEHSVRGTVTTVIR
ncbi:MAG: hypothetical protein ABIH41_03550 [Nanoarchaeota archaeon]